MQTSRVELGIFHITLTAQQLNFLVKSLSQPTSEDSLYTVTILLFHCYFWCPVSNYYTHLLTKVIIGLPCDTIRPAMNFDSSLSMAINRCQIIKRQYPSVGETEH